MRIGIIGYGKMGKTIEQLAQSRGHEVTCKFSSKERDFSPDQLTCDVAIEFTQPESATNNIIKCFLAGIPVIVGTTGWYDKLKDVEHQMNQLDGTMFTATNFSLGVNLFFHLNKKLARMMEHFPEYKAAMQEIHHTEKKDAPSGTAITLAEGIIENHRGYANWINQPTNKENTLGIESLRKVNIPGTHLIRYSSVIDDIEIKHTAHSRDGFALGAVIASEWVIGKKGHFGMDDLMTLES